MEDDPLSNENSLESFHADGANSADEHIPPPNVVMTTGTEATKQTEGITFKRKRTEDSDGIEFHKRFESCQFEDDPIDVFFKSMALSVKRLPPELVAEAKLKVCNIVSEMELRALRTFADIVAEQDDKEHLKTLMNHD